MGLGRGSGFPQGPCRPGLRSGSLGPSCGSPATAPTKPNRQRHPGPDGRGAERQAGCGPTCLGSKLGAQSRLLSTLSPPFSTLPHRENTLCSRFVGGRPETLRIDTVSWGPIAHRAPQVPGPCGSRRGPAWPLSPLCCALRAPAAPKGQEHTQSQARPGAKNCTRTRAPCTEGAPRQCRAARNRPGTPPTAHPPSIRGYLLLV